MVGIILTIVTTISVVAQPRRGLYSKLSRYHNWSIVAGPVLYDKARIYIEYGDYTFSNKNTFSFNAGFEYDFYPERKWSLITGFIVGLEPAYNFSYQIKKEDIYPNFTEDWKDKDKMYSLTSFSAPLLLRLRIQINQNYYINFLTGLKIMFFPPGDAEFLLRFHNEDDTEIREVFGLRAESPDNMFQGSFIIGSGVSYTMKRMLVNTKLIYVMNFQNIMNGEYLFDNMFVSERTYGSYELSGNYIGLLFSVQFTKNK